MLYKTAKKKADALLKIGDALGVAGKRAESKRKLRKCRRLRMMQRKLEYETMTPALRRGSASPQEE